MFRSALASTSRMAMRAAARPAAAPVARAPIAAAQQVRAYHPKVIDHYENPRNVGKMNKADADVGTGLVGAPACGE